MRETYVKHYANGMMLRASLGLLWDHISWPPDKTEALTMTEFGPFFLTGNNAPYLPVFFRAADRVLYHATNAWRQLVANLSIIPYIQNHLEPGAYLQTNDRATKYEIEAFLGAVVSITEENLIGVDTKGKFNRLGKSNALDANLIGQLRAEADAFRALGFESKWRDVRNSAYHLNPQMHDWGFLSQIGKVGERYIVYLEGIHYIEGAPSNLIELFADCYNAFYNYVTTVRDLITLFSFSRISVPRNNRYSTICDPLGNMIVGLGATGYEFRHFPQTASDFVGPLKTG